MAKNQYEILNVVSSFILSLVIIFLPFQYEEILHSGKVYLSLPLIVPILVILKSGKMVKIFSFFLKVLGWITFRFFKVKIKIKAIDSIFSRYPTVEIFFAKLGKYRDKKINSLLLFWKNIGSLKKRITFFLAWLPVTIILFFVMVSYSLTVRQYIYKYIMSFFTEYHFEKREKNNKKMNNS